MDIEEKLLKFRQQNKLTEEKSAEKRSIFDYFSWTKKQPQSEKLTHKENDAKCELNSVKKENSITKRSTSSTANKLLVHEVADDDESTKNPEEFKLYIIQLILKVSLWLVLFILFIKLEFGAVYFVISLLVLIYMNTNVKKKGKISAYSVFNPNLERIQGTFTPEHVEKSITGTL